MQPEVVAGVEPGPSLEQCALEQFQPLVFCVASHTPTAVNLDRVVDAVRRDAAFAGRFHVIDTRVVGAGSGGLAAAGDSVGSAKGAASRRKSAADAKKSHGGGAAAGAAVTDATKTGAAYVRDEYVRLAVTQEEARRRAADRRVAELHALRDAYLEDGLSEEAALRAAEEDMRDGVDEEEAEEDEEEGDDEEGGLSHFPGEQPNDEQTSTQQRRRGPRRHPQYVCVRGFPKNLADLEELNRIGVMVHVILCVDSKVALPGSLKANGEDGATEVVRGKSEAAATPRQRTAGTGKRPKTNEAHLENVLVSQMEQHMAAPHPAYNAAVDEAYLCTFEFPTEPVAAPSTESSASSPVYRLVGTESAIIGTLLETITVLEARLHRFKQWTALRQVLPIPRYTEVRSDPNAAGAATDDTRVDAAVSGVRKTTILPAPPASSASLTAARLAASGGNTLSTPPMATSLTTVGGLTSTTTIAAIPAPVRELYETVLAGAQRERAGDVCGAADVVRGCVQQAAHNTMTTESNTAVVLTEAAAPSGAAEDTDRGREKEIASTVQAASAVLQRVLRGSGTVSTDGMPPRRLTTTPSTTLSHSLLGDVSLPSLLAASAAATLDEVVDRALSSMPFAFNSSSTTTTTAAECKETEVRSTLSFGLCGLASQAMATAISPQLAAKNQHGWRRAVVGWRQPEDASPHSLQVDVLCRGDGAPRTQHTVYSFEGPTTFAEFVRLLDYSEAERHFFYPPPRGSADVSDEDQEQEEEEEEETEDSEDGDDMNDSSLSPEEAAAAAVAARERRERRRKKKEPTPPPLLDHVGLHQAALRRRRVLQSALAFSSTGCRQELTTVATSPPSAEGETGAVNTTSTTAATRTAVEEVHWIFPEDGTVVEVEQTCGSTKQITTTVTPAKGVWCGMCYTQPHATTTSSSSASNAAVRTATAESAPSPPSTSVAATAALSPPQCEPLPPPPPEVPANVRTYAAVGDRVQIWAEVMADNAAAAAQSAYEAAVQAAKAEAFAQFEASGGARAKPNRGGAKNTASNVSAAQNLASLEETLIATIPKPPAHAKELPTMRLDMLFRGNHDTGGRWHAATTQYTCTARFLEGDTPTLQLSPARVDALALDLSFIAWGGVGAAVDRITVSRLQRLVCHADGTLELVSPDAAEYRVLLGPRGGYCVQHRRTGCTITVSHTGRCTGRRADGAVTALQPLHRATEVVEKSKDTVEHREDGVYIVRRADGVVRATHFGRDCSAVYSADPQSFSWNVRGLPSFTVDLSQGRCLGVRNNEGDGVLIDVDELVATVYDHAADGCVSFDVVGCRVQLRPTAVCEGVASCYTMDAAFGGLYGSVTRSVDAKTEETVYRVSPFGRCSVEREGRLLYVPVHPPQQPFPMRHKELLYPAFAEALAGVDMSVDRDAVHLQPTVVQCVKELTPLAAPPNPTSLSERQYKERVARELRRIVQPATAPDGATEDHATGSVASEAASAAAALVTTPTPLPRAPRLLYCTVTVVPSADAAAAVDSGSCVAFCGPFAAQLLVEDWLQPLLLLRAHATDSPPVRLPVALPTTCTAATGGVEQYAVTLCDSAQPSSDVVVPPPTTPPQTYILLRSTPSTAFGAPLLCELMSTESLCRAADATAREPRRGSRPPSDASILPEDSILTRPPSGRGETASSAAAVAAAAARGGFRHPPTPTAAQASFLSNDTNLLSASSRRPLYWQSALWSVERAGELKDDVLMRTPESVGIVVKVPRTSPTPPSAAPPKRAAVPLSVTPSVGGPNTAISAAAPFTAASDAPLYTGANAAGALAIPLLHSHKRVGTAKSSHASSAFVAAPQPITGGTSASSRGHYPGLAVSPASVDFGTVYAGRVYRVMVSLTNTSTVPCRFRVVLPPSPNTHDGVVVQYPKRFIAPGITEQAEVRLTGYQNVGELRTAAIIRHEGGSVSLPIGCRTLPAEDARVSSCGEESAESTTAATVPTRGVICLGESPLPFVPGTTKRFRRRRRQFSAGGAEGESELNAEIDDEEDVEEDDEAESSTATTSSASSRPAGNQQASPPPYPAAQAVL